MHQRHLQLDMATRTYTIVITYARFFLLNITQIDCQYYSIRSYWWIRVLRSYDSKSAIASAVALPQHLIRTFEIIFLSQINSMSAGKRNTYSFESICSVCPLFASQPQSSTVLYSLSLVCFSCVLVNFCIQLFSIFSLFCIADECRGLGAWFSLSPPSILSHKLRRGFDTHRNARGGIIKVAYTLTFFRFNFVLFRLLVFRFITNECCIYVYVIIHDYNVHPQLTRGSSNSNQQLTLI